MLHFHHRHTYERRDEITQSLDVWFRNGIWLDICDQQGAVKKEVLDWCEANLKSPYTFGKMSVRAVTLDHLHLHVTSDTDAINFMMMWF